MTLNTTYSPAVAEGNGVTTDFSYSFNPLSPSYLRVSLEVGGEWIEQLSGWTATTSTSGGIVTFDVAPTSRVLIERVVPEEQPTPYTTSAGFQAKVVEHSFDLLTGMVQQVQEQANRAVAVTIGSDINPAEVIGEVQRVWTSIDNIDAVADSLPDVNNVAQDLTNVDIVANNISSVNTTASNIAKVNTVAGSITNVDSVAAGLSDVNTVASNIADVHTVAGVSAAVSTVAGISTDVSTVSGISSDVTSVAGNASDISAVAGNATNINAVNANKTNIDTVAGIDSDVAALASISSNVTAVAGNATNINDVAGNATNINAVAGDIANINAVAADLANINNASTYADNANIWAEGTDAQVQALGGVHSSKGWAEYAEEIAQAVGDPANRDLSNLSATGQAVLDAKQDVATAVNYDNISNCITEIPQDIKLELNDGTLTLKAGSKVYVPNGSGVFDTITTITDKTLTATGNATYLVFLGPDQNLHYFTGCGSGASTPTSGYVGYYNTSDNKIYCIENGVNSGRMSFPIAEITISGGTISNIDQIFNGFGYIGSTVFALPGVKGLVPDGRNEDGSLKSIEFETDHVSTVTNVSGLICDLWYAINQYGDIANSLVDYWKYDEQKNTWAHDGVSWGAWMPFARSYTNGGKVENFTSKTPFHALDYNDSPKISGWSMPSSRYINLTLGASGSQYTAPANGWFYINKVATDFNQYLTLDTGVVTRVWSSGSNQGLAAFAPVLKGRKLTVTYSVAGDTQFFRFIYAEGDK